MAGAAETELGVAVGYRAADMRWSIAGNANGCCPNVLSELSWDDLEVTELALDLRLLTPEGLILAAGGAYGTIRSGDNRDSDYLGDDRSLEFSRSENTTDGDAMWHGSLGLGWRLPWRGGEWSGAFVPRLGYAVHGQDLRITEGYQTLPPLGAFDGLDSSYRARWKGPWAGLDVDLVPSTAFTLVLGLQYHWPDYYAEANWNLREDFAHPKSFEHEADGRGEVYRVGLRLPGPASALQWRVDAARERWETDAGVDRVFFADGTSAVTRLNEVVLNTWSISAGIDARF